MVDPKVGGLVALADRVQLLSQDARPVHHPSQTVAGAQRQHRRRVREHCGSSDQSEYGEWVFRGGCHDEYSSSFDRANGTTTPYRGFTRISTDLFVRIET